MDMYHGPPPKTPRARRLENTLQRWRLADQHSHPTILGVFVGVWGGMAAMAALIFVGLPLLYYATALVLPTLIVFCIVGAAWGFAKRRWRR
jgi:hypothetical protein